MDPLVCFIDTHCYLAYNNAVYHVIFIGASLSEPHTNYNFVQWFVHEKTAVKSGLPHTTVSLVGWFKHYNTWKITLNPYKCVCNTTKTVLIFLVLHVWSYSGSCHGAVNDEDYWHSIYGHGVVHAMNWWMAKITDTPYMVVWWFINDANLKCGQPSGAHVVLLNKLQRVSSTAFVA